jgi:hypothetical protein
MAAIGLPDGAQIPVGWYTSNRRRERNADRCRLGGVVYIPLLKVDIGRCIADL